MNMPRWAGDLLYKWLLLDRRYSWLGGTGTYDNPLGPVNPRSEEAYKTAIAESERDVSLLCKEVFARDRVIAELKDEQKMLRAVIDKLDKTIKENELVIDAVDRFARRTAEACLDMWDRPATIANMRRMGSDYEKRVVTQIEALIEERQREE